MKTALRGLLIPVALALAWPAAAQNGQQGWMQFGSNATLSIGSTSASVALPAAGSVPPPPNIRVCNTGGNDAYVAFGGAGVVATSANSYVKASTCQLFAPPSSATTLAAIASTSTSTLEIEAGTGSPQAGGGGGSGGPPSGNAGGDLGGTYPSPTVTSGLHLSGTLASGLTAPGLIVTGSLTATGLVTNADLANPATTVNGQTCTLGSSCTVQSTVPLSVGSSTGNVFTAPNGYFICTSTCTVTPPVPAAGYQFCVLNDDNVSTVITLGALGSSASYENTARTAYGTAGTGTFISGGAVGDKVCIVGRDATHYSTLAYNGTWTAD